MVNRKSLLQKLGKVKKRIVREIRGIVYGFFEIKTFTSANLCISYKCRRILRRIKTIDKCCTLGSMNLKGECESASLMAARVCLLIGVLQNQTANLHIELN